MSDGSDFILNYLEKVPMIDRIDSVNGIVYFKRYNTVNFQIVVYKYVRQKIGEHKNKKKGTKMSDHRGKRFKETLVLVQGTLEWQMPESAFRQGKNNFYKFGFVCGNMISPMTELTVTAFSNNRSVNSKTKIILK